MTFRFFPAHVVRSVRLGPSMVRITFGGEELAGFASGGRDQSFSLFLPHPGQEAPVVPVEEGDGWFTAWRALDPAVRAVMRSYTVREQRRQPDELDVDFVLHGVGTAHSGPASRWAAHASPGDRVLLLGPAVPDNKSVGFRPPADTDWVLLAADETALPAAAAILDQLPEGTRAKAWLEVPHEADIQPLRTDPAIEVVWLPRDRTPVSLPEAIRAAALPPGTPYAWLAGESGTVRALRRHLVNERDTDRRRVTFTGYWRRGVTEEELRAEAG
ncbi:siderophore-interacting protein [Streptomyces gamaensis]|uniref:Siderophore-interacting protein n=1 Tax=Streptomyces gamaensis TaxID=1763542 RepID=A0ABW0Z193_9ACTN